MNINEMPEKVKEVIKKSIALNIGLNDEVYYIDANTKDIKSCMYKDKVFKFGLFFFTTYEDAKFCEEWLVGFYKEIDRRFLESMLNGINSYTDISEIYIGKTTPFEVDIKDLSNYSAYANINTEDIHIARKRFSYYDIYDAKKVVAYYKGLEV